MENKNMMTADAYGWENDPDFFIHLTGSPEQCKRRAARRQKDADRNRMISILHVVGVAAINLAIVLFVICTAF